jgi:PAS domain-containing protein
MAKASPRRLGVRRRSSAGPRAPHKAKQPAVRATPYLPLFEHMLNGVAYCRMEFAEGRPQDFTYLAVNPAFERLTGLKGVVGKKVSVVIPGIRESTPDLFEAYARVSLTGVPDEIEIWVEPLKIQNVVRHFDLRSPPEAFRRGLRCHHRA